MICEKQKKARKALLARVKTLVDNVLFKPAVSSQQVVHEELRDSWQVVKRRYHSRFGNQGYSAASQRCCGAGSQCSARETSFAEELSFPQQADDGVLAVRRCDGDLDAAFLNEENRIGSVTLDKKYRFFQIV